MDDVSKIHNVMCLPLNLLLIQTEMTIKYRTVTLNFEFRTNYLNTIKFMI